ncbi:MAG: hypothetical protein ACREGC_03655, partial [Minisyncoccia bacterium]
AEEHALHKFFAIHTVLLSLGCTLSGLDCGASLPVGTEYIIHHNRLWCQVLPNLDKLRTLEWGKVAAEMRQFGFV